MSDTRYSRWKEAVKHSMHWQKTGVGDECLPKEHRGVSKGVSMRVVNKGMNEVPTLLAASYNLFEN